VYTLTQIDTFIPPSNKNDWKIEADQKAVLANIPSSYRTNNYCSVFQYLIERYKPEKVIEFGVLGGYSTISIAIALSKLKRGKIIGYDLFEGGSLSRDEVDWMVSFNKKRMNPPYKSYAKKYKITTIQEYPSMTVVERGR